MSTEDEHFRSCVDVSPTETWPSHNWIYPHKYGWLVLMKKRLLLLALPIAMVSIACAPGVGALDPETGRATETPEQSVATPQPQLDNRLSAVKATTSALTTSARPEPVRIEPTAASVPVPTPRPRPVVNAPAPKPTATRQPTATPVRFDPNATPTPLWSSPPTPVPTVTPTPAPVGSTYVPPRVAAAAPEQQFQSPLNYQYILPTGWSEVRTESSLILYDGTGKIGITITEQLIEPWKFPTALALAAQLNAAIPTNWDYWQVQSQRPIRSGSVYEFQYEGSRDGNLYKSFIQWFLWGDMHVQVSADVPQLDWDENASISHGLAAVMNSFEPHDGSPVYTESEAMALLEQRLDARQSGIFARNEIIRARYELTCNQIFTDLIPGADHFGDGLWQMTAQTLEGSESWRVYEPSGAVHAFDSNNSRC